MNSFRKAIQICAVVEIMIAIGAASQFIRPGASFGGPAYVDDLGILGGYSIFLGMLTPVYIMGWVATEKMKSNASPQTGFSPETMAGVFLYCSLLTPLMPIVAWILYSTKSDGENQTD